MKIPKQPWWRTDDYTLAGPDNGPDMSDANLWGPKGPAVVPLYLKDGETKTGPGWGRDTFMDHYRRLEFAPRRVLHQYEKKQQPFAWVMRAARLVCIDIDGKNGGFDHVAKLGLLPPTLAEVSMSGNGYHLFYLADDEWDEKEGFALYRDAIGVVQGVDIRGTGCVYHKPTQRWNGLNPVPLPNHLKETLLQRQRRQDQNSVVIKKTLQLDKEEILIMQDQIIDELKKDIPQGKRNQTLFAIGTKLRQAEVPDWNDLIADRANEVGLDSHEIDKLIANIEKYGV